MAEAITKLPVKTEEKKAATALGHGDRSKICAAKSIVCSKISAAACGARRSDVLSSTSSRSASARSTWAAAPAVDVAETEKAYEITAELPGMDEKNVEVKFADGVLTIKGEKQEEKEEKKKDYYLSERSYGSFQRAFQVPDGVDADKIEATFKNGVLTVTMPKSAEAQKSAKKITVKAA